MRAGRSAHERGLARLELLDSLGKIPSEGLLKNSELFLNYTPCPCFVREGNLPKKPRFHEGLKTKWADLVVRCAQLPQSGGASPLQMACLGESELPLGVGLKH